MATAPAPGLPESQRRAPLCANQADGSSPPPPPPAPILHCRPGDAEHRSARAESRCPTLPGPLVAKLEAACSLEPEVQADAHGPWGGGSSEASMLAGLVRVPRALVVPAHSEVSSWPRGENLAGRPTPQLRQQLPEAEHVVPTCQPQGLEFIFLNICSVPGTGLDRETSCSPCLVELSLAQARTSKKEITGGGNESQTDWGTRLGSKQGGLPEEGMAPRTDWWGPWLGPRTSRWIRDVRRQLQRERLAAWATQFLTPHQASG